MLSNIVLGLLLLMLVVMATYLVKSKVDQGYPEIAGHQLYIVLSGSMSPEFNAGSVIFVKHGDPGELEIGDVITFADGNTKVTHRIVGKETGGFVTRGDANNSDDPKLVNPENVLGRVALSIPLLGYLLNFSRTKEGLLLVVIIPGLVIVAQETRVLWKYAAQIDRQRVAHKQREPDGVDIT